MKVINLKRERERRKKERERSPLAQALAGYLELNLSAATQLPGWLASTLWTYELYPERVTAAEIREALEELGGGAYRRSLLERSQEPAPRSNTHQSGDAGGNPRGLRPGPYTYTPAGETAS